MAGIVYTTDNKKFSIAKAEYATVLDGNLSVYERGQGSPDDILAVFVSGSWLRFVRDGEVVRSSNNTHTTLSASVASES